MTNPTMNKYRTIRPINDVAVTDAMLRVLIEIPNAKQEDFWIRDQKVGNVCLYRDSRFPGKLVEYVQGSKDDSVTTLLEDNGLFQSRKQVVDMREDLIMEIAKLLMALPGTVLVMDEGRERKVFLRELGTAQLFDVLVNFAQKDLASI